MEQHDRRTLTHRRGGDEYAAITDADVGSFHAVAAIALSYLKWPITSPLLARWCHEHSCSSALRRLGRDTRFEREPEPDRTHGDGNGSVRHSWRQIGREVRRHRQVRVR